MRRSTTQITAALVALLLFIATPALSTVSTINVPGECVSACAGDELATFDAVKDLCVCLQGEPEELAQGEQGSWWSAFTEWVDGYAESGVAWCPFSEL